MFPFAWFVVGSMVTFMVVLGVVTAITRDT